MPNKLVYENYQTYLKYLRHLVAIPSPFDNPTSVEKIITFCESELSANLKDYTLKRDGGGNLIGCPSFWNPANDLLFLSAHADTATANPSEWDPPFHPYIPHEDDHEIVARGVSDCKAGLAYQLFLAAMAAKGQLDLKNVFFSITFKEEGPGFKSGIFLGKAFGHDLPVAEKNTYFLALENTVSASGPISLFLSEKSNFAIKIRGQLAWCKSVLQRLNQWNPIFIGPTEFLRPPEGAEKFTQMGGHACSVGRDKNLLTSIILNADENSLLWAGTETEFATIPKAIFKFKSPAGCDHTCVLSNRGFDTLEDVELQLEGIPHVRMKDFAISSGLRASEHAQSTPLVKSLISVSNPPLIGTNDGSTDATIVYSSMTSSVRKRFFPLVIGPGTRSQRQRKPPRLTHGKNETFDKQSGFDCVLLLTKALVKCKFAVLRS